MSIQGSAAKPPAPPNHGTVWVNNVGDETDPGHDPHLTCNNLQILGYFLANPSGPFEIFGWPPSGHKALAYASTWKYVPKSGSIGGGVQIIAIVPVKVLIAGATANGDKPINKQGLHFKLTLTNAGSHEKNKTFWVNCTTPTPTPTPTAKATPTPRPTDKDRDRDKDKDKDKDKEEATPTGSEEGATSTPSHKATPTPTPIGSQLGVTTTPTPSPTPTHRAVTGSVLGIVTTPNTGAAAPFTLGSLLALLGFAALRARRRIQS